MAKKKEVKKQPAKKTEKQKIKVIGRIITTIKTK